MRRKIFEILIYTILIIAFTGCENNSNNIEGNTNESFSTLEQIDNTAKELAKKAVSDELDRKAIKISAFNDDIKNMSSKAVCEWLFKGSVNTINNKNPYETKIKKEYSVKIICDNNYNLIVDYINID